MARDPGAEAFHLHQRDLRDQRCLTALAAYLNRGELTPEGALALLDATDDLASNGMTLTVELLILVCEDRAQRAAFTDPNTMRAYRNMAKALARVLDVSRSV